MGIVYRAVDERDGRLVALKVIRGAEAPGDEGSSHVAEARVRFEREASILRGLLHVNIVSFYEIGEEDGTPFLAMEFLEGLPLTQFAGRPYIETIPLLIQASHGMEYLATRGIVHRDLSPDNIFVVGSGSEQIVKLLDFGIAKLFETATGLESLTATGFFLGKVAYGSPEQLGSLGHGAPLDWRSDVYSLGVIFYQILAGRRPFEGKAPVEYIAAHLNVPAPPVAAPHDSPALPMGLVRLVAQMLEKRREDRPRSYREIIDRLVATLRDEPAAARNRHGGIGLADPAEATGLTALVGPAEAHSHRETLRATRALGSPLSRVAIAVILLAGVLGFLVLKERPRPAGTRRAAKITAVIARTAAPARAAPPAAVPAPIAELGRLQLLSSPFSEVLSLTEIRSGRVLPLPPGATTPFVNEALLGGTYRVVLRCAVLGGQSAVREVTIRPGETSLVAHSFLTTDALLETLK